MDFNAINTTLNTSTAQNAGMTQFNTNASHKMPVKAVEEPVMMDLKDVQNFLYMMIGSEVLVQARNSSLGTAFNQLA